MAREYRPRVPVELAERINAVRGDVPFEAWVRRALERALLLPPGFGGGSFASDLDQPAPRASKEAPANDVGGRATAPGLCKPVSPRVSLSAHAKRNVRPSSLERKK